MTAPGVQQAYDANQAVYGNDPNHPHSDTVASLTAVPTLVPGAPNLTNFGYSWNYFLTVLSAGHTDFITRMGNNVGDLSTLNGGNYGYLNVDSGASRGPGFGR